MNELPEFDVFLAHNTQDKPQVRLIGSVLKQRRLKVWLDEEQIIPGQIFQLEIQKAISKVKSAVIFIGQTGLGRWQYVELQTLYSQFVQAENVKTIIPVLLPRVNEIPKDLLFLAQYHWVSFTNGIDDVEALHQLEWGITGRKPERKSNQKQVIETDVLQSNDLSSAKGINYTKLRDFLAERKWKQADQETTSVMLQVANRQKEGWLDVGNIKIFPSIDLRTIDTLWVKFSRERFGFSVQKRIWQEANQAYTKFGKQVAWYKYDWIIYFNIIYSSNAPTGHLPCSYYYILSKFRV
ncbi:MAG: GUN4 domain-containing protein [Nostoc sp. DedQUE08]|uniref:GUN4 domain-containing protein n=1 Tax=Nostoc sp. DedQUE08 TaxID=3075393 RepID=UPI002AD2A388|nr:GUN4 domain-containing protein [Nostoc sp. DedQUE08]MDZ8068541.1 GUN4 domain-containing protein [Nostoc sp. DedQUE08]